MKPPVRRDHFVIEHLLSENLKRWLPLDHPLGDADGRQLATSKGRWRIPVPHVLTGRRQFANITLFMMRFAAIAYISFLNNDSSFGRPFLGYLFDCT